MEDKGKLILENKRKKNKIFNIKKIKNVKRNETAFRYINIS